MSEEKVMYAKSKVAEIPKPMPLIGGTEVYKKDNGLPYWYCKIKGGRDEFMHLYFEDLTERDLFYDWNGKLRKFTTEKQKNFKNYVLKALKNKHEEGYRWIPVFEPSSEEGKLQFTSNKQVLINMTSYNWEKIFKEYSPSNGSQQASITTYFLLLLRWLKDGVATLEQLADDSTEIGHYWNSKKAKRYKFERTGSREFGGLFGFAGNTYKIVKDPEAKSDFSLVGGYYDFSGDNYPVARVCHDFYQNYYKIRGVGLLELTK